MKDSRHVDVQIARRVFGRRVLQQEDGSLFEEIEPGEEIPLTAYSSDIGAAWRIIELLPMTLIPIENGNWFALVGEKKGWTDPGEFLKFLQTADFVKAGAAVAESAALSICLAAIKAVEKRDLLATDFNLDAGMPH